MTPLPLPLNALLLLFGAALGIIDARRVLRRHPDFNLESGMRRVWHLPLLLVPLIGLLIFHFYGQRNPRIAWSFPLWLELYYTAITWGIILAGFSFLFAFGLHMAFAEGHKERWKLAFAVALLIGVVQWVQWRHTRPAVVGPPQIQSGVVLQTHGSTCAAASSANLLRQLGREGTEAEMVELLGTTEGGTSTAQIIVGLRQIGLECQKIEREDPRDLIAPAFIFIDNPVAGPESHAVLYVGRRGARVEYHDPVDGPHVITPESLKEIWPGRAVECAVVNP